MTEVPKIVIDRLRAVVPDQAHPDAGLLTAFTEQTLSATERDGVLEHLALCRDCREAIALALPPADIVAVPIADETAAAIVEDQSPLVPAQTVRSWLRLAWPNLVWPRLGGPGLRWAALAAGVVVAASVLLVRPGKLNQAVLPSANRQVTTSAAAVSSSQIASSSVPSPSAVARSPMNQSAASPKPDQARPKPEVQLSRKFPAQKLQAGHVVTPSQQAESGMLLADNKKESAQANKLPTSPSAGALAFDASTRPADETVEVASATTAVTTDASADGTLVARSEAPAIEKAKPAMQSQNQNAEATSGQPNELQKAGAAAAPRLRLQSGNVTSAAKPAPAPSKAAAQQNIAWTITSGVLRRSLDGGQSWRDVFHPSHPLLCSASHDRDIWTGGQAGTLFHSADGGVTWVQVKPSVKDQQLSSDVTHIDLRGATDVGVSTGNNEIWRSADGGTTWEKK